MTEAATGVLVADTAVGPVVIVTGVVGKVEQEVAEAIARSQAIALEVNVHGLWLLPDACPGISHAAIQVRSTPRTG